MTSICSESTAVSIQSTSSLNVYSFELTSIGGDPEKVKASQRARFADETVVDQIMALDAQSRKGKYPAKVGVLELIKMYHD